MGVDCLSWFGVSIAVCDVAQGVVLDCLAHTRCGVYACTDTRALTGCVLCSSCLHLNNPADWNTQGVVCLCVQY